MLRREFLFEDNHSEEWEIPITGLPVTATVGGSKIYGKVMLPAVKSKEERTPVLLLLHGHPGQDRNLDLMFSLPRAGIAVAFFSYRGIWGSHGDYCFSHLMEDTRAMFEQLKEHAEEWRLDMDHCYLFGHSMGGFTLLNSLAQGLPVRGAIAMAPCDLAYVYEEKYDDLVGKIGYVSDFAFCNFENPLEVTIIDTNEKLCFSFDEIEMK